jgi:hypothetical protein
MNFNIILITIIFISAIYMLPLLSLHFRNDKNLTITYYFIITLYQIIAFTNAFWFRTIGADMDANSFHVIAVEISKDGEFLFYSGASLYKNILGLLYWLTEPSLIIGEQFSILIISISIIFFVKIIDLYKLNLYQIPLVICYAGLPTMIMLGAITLREPLEICLLIIAVYFSLKVMLYTKGKVINFALMTLFCLAATLFHRALFVYVPFLIFLTFVCDFNKTSSIFVMSKRRALLALFIPIILFIMFYFFSNFNINGSEIFRMNSLTDLMEAIKRHRLATPIGRASYEISFNYSSYIDIIYSFLIIYLNYLFAPFVWQVSSITDLYAFLEATIYIILLYYSIKLWISTNGQLHKMIGVMLVLFLIMSLIWALGTTNYGTGMRHKLLSWWMLVLTGTPLLYERLKSSFNIMFK